MGDGGVDLMGGPSSVGPQRELWGVPVIKVQGNIPADSRRTLMDRIHCCALRLRLMFHFL